MRGTAAAVGAALVVGLLGTSGAPASGQAAPVAAVSVVSPGPASTTPVERAPSRRLVVPAIGVDAGIIPVGVNRSGALAVGRSVSAVYRWRDGVVAGQPGSAVLAGHTWSRGNGVFDRLGSLSAGDRVSVGRVRFEVTRVRRVARMSREDVRALFSDRGRARLVLITCGDRNNLTGVYATRIIVNAKKV
jgi:LPXTG-site transpeptidase (sortase) family protein